MFFLSDPCGLMCYHLDGRPMNKYRVWEACNALQISWVGAKSSDSAKTIKEEKTSLGTCFKMISEVLIICWLRVHTAPGISFWYIFFKFIKLRFLEQCVFSVNRWSAPQKSFWSRCQDLLFATIIVYRYNALFGSD